ncbi:MAG: gfo/Idh/MocA family oxidoreductase [Chthoniobacter sp.]|jgi:myo-inositol 2-dehydrogenase/D-chiro-inositol 1-dehydrogenase|nr:gfo/Idh/MocA family oxidoreductase [Chthoniobacter sp.]
MEHSPIPAFSRRRFVGTSAAALAGSALLGAMPVRAEDAASKKLRIALVGCGGRGSGAANQALKADSNVTLAALADVVEEQADKALENLRNQHPDKVTDTQKFIGLDAIDRVLASDVDVVLLTTPPGFRPEHFEKAVKAGKHVFCEKPVAVDAPGVRRFMEAAKLSKEKKLGVQSGFCWRANFAERATFEQIEKGTIGKVSAVYGDYLGGTPWVKPRKEGWTDLEWQLRNWMYFTWLSGDHLVEQAVHTVDKMSWAFGDVAPLRAVSLGGRQQRVEPEYGHIFDHFAVMYEYPDGARGTIFARQQAGTFNQNSDHIIGSKGYCDINGFKKLHRITGETSWKYEGPKNDMYQTEHDEFFASIRQGQPLNFADKLAHSTMVAILGRMAAYTGQMISWEDALASQESLAPKEPLTWDMKLEVPPVAMPGRTKLI